MLTSVKNVCVVTTFYTLEGMKSILLPEFVFFRSRLRLSLKNTNSIFYCFIFVLRECCTSYYNIPTSLPEGGYRDVEGAVPYQFDLCLTCGRSKPLPYRHNVPYPPQGGISSRQRLVYHHASAWISSPLPQLILPRKINFTCAKHKLHCEATSLGEAKLHRTARCFAPLPYRHNVPYPPQGGISSRQRLVYHHASAWISLHRQVPWI